MSTQASFWLGRYARIADKSSPNRPRTEERGQIVGINTTIAFLRYADGGHESAGMGILVLDEDQHTPVWEPPKAPEPEQPPVYVVACPSRIERGADGEKLLDAERFPGHSWSTAHEALGLFRRDFPDTDHQIFECHPLKSNGWWVIREGTKP